MPRNHLNKPLSQYTDDNFSKEEINLFESHLNSPEAQDVEKAQKEEIQSQKDKLVVIDEAKYQFGAHLATFKPLTKTPSIQGKTVGTIVETQPVNFSFVDGFQLTSLGQWEKYGTIKFQNNEVILQGSVISYVGQIPGSNTVETGKAKCIQSGQKKTLEHIDTTNEAFPSYKTPPPSTNCIVKFSLNENYSNLFGFDSYEISSLGCITCDELKKTYKKLTPFHEEYLIPWVSLQQNGTAKLKVEVWGNNYNQITFKDPDENFVFNPLILTHRNKEVSIFCKNKISSNYLVEVYTDGRLAGALIFVENSVKKLKFPINWYKVSFNEEDIKKSNELVDIQKIKNYCKKAFTSALIDIEINEIPTNLDISKLKENSRERIIKKDSVKQVNKLSYLLYFSVPRNPFQISLFTTYLKNINKEGGFQNGFTWHSEEMCNSTQIFRDYLVYDVVAQMLSKTKEELLSHTLVNEDEEICTMYLKNLIKDTETEIPHELMHALGLDHTFPENKLPNKKILFDEGSTKNYMDYNNSKETTFKWQWDILRSSKYLKILILAFTLLFTSCRTMSSKEIQEVSCKCNDTITQEDKRLPIPPTEIVKNDSIESYTTGYGNPYVKYIHYLKTNLQKMIYYDAQGNIKETFLSIPYEFIGRSFIFDEQGNIKEVIDYEKGWTICAFQALAIAKKYAGNNFYEKKPLWRVYRQKIKGKNIWLAMYKDKKYKWVYLYINSKTGKIIQKSSKELKDDDNDN
ncbi:peptidase [Capnocytophaga sputigena]|uniref:peptidase n=1 Tax=Capnocytophaga sputigena TaxID=1019 RepID=UPI0028D27C59|nr:peptidase [Capnocytophaga sputigena]